MGAMRCTCDMSFPPLVRGWDAHLENQINLCGAYFEVLKLHSNFLINMNELYLLEVGKLDKSICNKYNKILITYSPTSPRIGTVPKHVRQTSTSWNTLKANTV